MIEEEVKLDKYIIEEFRKCKYLGHEIRINKDKQTHELLTAINLRCAVHGKLKYISKNDIPISLYKYNQLENTYSDRENS